MKIPIIDVTDLYHPHQDPGDNFDLVAAYALPELDLRAVILDCTERYRRPYAHHDNPDYRDFAGPREPGIIPVEQLNYIFNRAVPYGIGCFRQMRSPGDPLDDIPRFQQRGIELILKTLRESEQKVHILSFGSARNIAAAYNRAPALFREKLARLHLSAGADGPFLEWNVMLDPHAVVCLLRSGLPVAIYPCATAKGPFDYGRHNTFWRLENLEFIRDMHPQLRRYLVYAFRRTCRNDFLRAMDEDPPADQMDAVCAWKHNVWETAIWLNVTGRQNDLKPCRVEVADTGLFTWSFTSEPTNFWMYDRGDPYANERQMRELLSAWYKSFRP